MLAGKFAVVSKLIIATAGGVEIASDYSGDYIVAQATCSKLVITVRHWRSK